MVIARIKQKDLGKNAEKSEPIHLFFFRRETKQYENRSQVLGTFPRCDGFTKICFASVGSVVVSLKYEIHSEHKKIIHSYTSSKSCEKEKAHHFNRSVKKIVCYPTRIENFKSSFQMQLFCS